MHTIDIVVHALYVLQKTFHVPLSVSLHRLRTIFLTGQDLTKIIKGQIAVNTAYYPHIIIIGHLGYGIVIVKHGFHTGQHVF